MIIKSYEISKINFKKINFFLLYGENEGFKNEIIKFLKNNLRFKGKLIIVLPKIKVINVN